MTLETYKQPGWPLGSNLAVAADEIPEGYARYIQDGLQDVPGVLRKRGPLTQVVAGTNNKRPQGLVGTYSPGGTFRIAIIEADASGFYYTFLDDTLTALSGVSYLIDTVTTANAVNYVVDSKPALGGGVLVGIASTWGERTEAANGVAGYHDTLHYWRGARLNETTTGTFTSVRGTTGIVGVGTSWLTTIEPGMFLFTTGGGQNHFVGVVSSVTSDTVMTLEFPASTTYGGQTFVISPIMLLCSGNNGARTMRGRITASTNSTIVTGGDTYFDLDAVVGGTLQSGTGVYIGTVASVTNDNSLTLNANAAANLNNSKYVVTHPGSASGGYPKLSNGNTAFVKLGFLNTVWRSMQFYANKNYQAGTGSPWISRVWYGLRGYYQSVSTDDTDSGQFFDVPSSIATGTPVTGLIGTETALLVFKQDETYSVTGDSPANWRVDRILHDGCLNPGSIVPYENGCIWAGRRGIYYYDGRQITNLTEASLGNVWEQAVSGVSWGSANQQAGFVYRDHLFLSIQFDAMPAGYGVVKGGTEYLPPNHRGFTLCINLKTGALSFMTNMYVRGSVRIPSASGGDVYYLVEKSNAGTRQPCVLKASDLFADGTTVDTVTCRDNGGNTANIGPQFYLESKKFMFDDETRKKWWREFAFWSWNESGTLTVEVIQGLANNYSVITNTLAATTAFTYSPLRLGKTSQYLQYRIYDCAALTRGAATRVKLGAYALRFKWMRDHRA